MKRFTVLIQIGETGSIGECEAIEHDGRIWIVPYWLESSSEAATKPMRLIPLDILRHQKLPPGNVYQADYILNDPMPKQLFEEEIPQQLIELFHVVERPDILFPAGSRKLQ